MRRMKNANCGVNSYPELNVDANKAHCGGVKVRPFSPHKGCATCAIGFTLSGTMAAGGWQHNVQKGRGRLFEIIQQRGSVGLSRCSGHPPPCCFSLTVGSPGFSTEHVQGRSGALARKALRWFG